MTAPTQQIHAHAVAWDRPCTGVEGHNERVIELPLAMEVAQLGTPGWVLDAGCALNSITNLVPEGKQPIAHLVHLTQSIASERLTPSGTQRSYVSADLRDLSIFADRAFDRTICVSTLEHVGLDNSQYHAPIEQNPESWVTALEELWRVTRTVLMITVPYSREPRVANERWRYFTDQDVASMRGVVFAYGAHAVVRRNFCVVNGKWGDGAESDVRSDRVTQVVCVKITR